MGKSAMDPCPPQFPGRFLYILNNSCSYDAKSMLGMLHVNGPVFESRLQIIDARAMGGILSRPMRPLRGVAEARANNHYDGPVPDGHDAAGCEICQRKCVSLRRTNKYIRAPLGWECGPR